MTPWMLSMLVLAMACTAAGPASAQRPDRPDRQAADPADPKALVPAPRHRSAFTGYRRAADVTPLAWPQANDQVHRIGGWRAYLREAHAPEGAASAPATERKP